MIKNFVKHFLGSIRCHLSGIDCSGGGIHWEKCPCGKW